MQRIMFLNEKWKIRIRYIFMAVFMLYAILGSNSITYGKSIITPVMWVAFLLSLMILGYRILNYKSYFKVPETILLLASILSIGLPTLINYKYSFKKNIIFCIYWVIYFLIFFATEKNKSRESCKKDIRFISIVFVLYTTVATFASLILYFMNVGVTKVSADAEFTYNLGFVWGRLWGVFINPNNGAISSAVSIVILIYVFITYKKIWSRVFAVFACILHLLYIIFSDSRSGAVVLSVCTAVFVLCIVLNICKNKRLPIKFLSFMLAACVGVCCFAGVRYLRVPINGIINLMSSEFEKTNPEKDPEYNIIDRGYDLSDDISNRRFDVWKSGMEVYLNSPKNMIIGLSFCGFTDYAREYMPQTYIVNNDYGDMTTLDNEFFNILIANGALGLLCMAAFVIYVLVCILKSFNSVCSKDKFFAALLLAIPVSLASAAMFSSVMFYLFSPNAVIFWSVLGCCVSFFKASREDMSK